MRAVFWSKRGGDLTDETFNSYTLKGATVPGTGCLFAGLMNLCFVQVKSYLRAAYQGNLPKCWVCHNQVTDLLPSCRVIRVKLGISTFLKQPRQHFQQKQEKAAGNAGSKQTAPYLHNGVQQDAKKFLWTELSG